MWAKVRIQRVHDQILNETRNELVVVRNRRSYIGTLFFEKETWEKTGTIIEEVIVDGSTSEILIAAYKLLKKHNMLASDGQTFKTMMHWQFVNGFSNDCLTYSIGKKTDKEVFQYMAELGIWQVYGLI
jgi:hypothetical protein